MACNNNTPAGGYIYIENLVITYADKSYSINNIYTNKKYLYFNTNAPSDLYISNQRTVEDDFIYIIKNNNGNALLIENPKIKMVFDNFDKDGVIKNINKVKLNITNNEQEMKEITTNVDNLSNVYKQDKSFNEIKEDFNTSVVNFNALLINLNTSLNSYLKDNKFIADEKLLVNTQLNNINNKSIEVLAYADALTDLYCEYVEKENLEANNTAEESNTDNVEDTSKILQYRTIIISLLTQLKDNLTPILESTDENVSSTDIIQVTSALTGIISSLSSLKEECNLLVFLGAGGTISDGIYAVNLRIDNIVTDLNELQDSILSSLSTERQQIQAYFDKIKNYLDKTVNVTNDINMSNGIVTKTQYSNLTMYVTIMKTEVDKINGSYYGYYSNENLSALDKKNLKENYTHFNSAFQKLSDLIYKRYSTLKVVQDDFSKYSAYLREFRTIRNVFNSKLLYCINVIDNALSNASLKQIRETLENDISQNKINISTLVTDVGNINSKIDRMNSKIDEMNNKLTSIDSKVQMLENRVSQLENKSTD